MTKLKSFDILKWKNCSKIQFFFESDKAELRVIRFTLRPVLEVDPLASVLGDYDPKVAGVEIVVNGTLFFGSPGLFASGMTSSSSSSSSTCRRFIRQI